MAQHSTEQKTDARADERTSGSNLPLLLSIKQVPPIMFSTCATSHLANRLSQSPVITCCYLSVVCSFVPCCKCCPVLPVLSSVVATSWNVIGGVLMAPVGINHAPSLGSLAVPPMVVCAVRTLPITTTLRRSMWLDVAQCGAISAHTLTNDHYK